MLKTEEVLMREWNSGMHYGATDKGVYPSLFIPPCCRYYAAAVFLNRSAEMRLLKSKILIVDLIEQNTVKFPVETGARWYVILNER